MAYTCRRLPWRQKMSWFVLAFFVLLVTFHGVSEAHPFDGDKLFQIVVQGEARARIVISDDRMPPEQYAANELRSVLQKMSGVRLDIVRVAHESIDDSRFNIVIGTPESLPSIAAADLFNSEHEEEIRIVRQGNTLF